MQSSQRQTQLLHPHPVPQTIQNIIFQPHPKRKMQNIRNAAGHPPDCYLLQITIRKIQQLFLQLQQPTVGHVYLE